jgi:hypothetical protein
MALSDARAALWKALLEQMDKSKPPPPGRCATCANAARPSHILCDPCRVQAGGYPFAA